MQLNPLYHVDAQLSEHGGVGPWPHIVQQAAVALAAQPVGQRRFLDPLQEPRQVIRAQNLLSGCQSRREVKQLVMVTIAPCGGSIDFPYRHYLL
jgi:hypothetical protein